MKKIVATLEPGSFLGEVCMLEKTERIASAKAKTDAHLLYLDIKEFKQQVKDHNIDALRMAYNISLTLIDRLTKANELLTKLEDASSNKTIREVLKYKNKLLEEGLF